MKTTEFGYRSSLDVELWHISYYLPTLVENQNIGNSKDYFSVGILCSEIRMQQSPNSSPALGLQKDRSFPGTSGILAKAGQTKLCLLVRTGPSLAS